MAIVAAMKRAKRVFSRRRRSIVECRGFDDDDDDDDVYGVLVRWIYCRGLGGVCGLGVCCLFLCVD
ncbi:hypothetical protein MtrunA17_Chr5g0432761 [Medicago truncatula]|uniref:Uncharacterized protein n=1 Tax=Medicago truncatula TaxID=3880 RepID=A0A396HTU3_MEDTR|nr:hypothetical protein MtrunA17_Chr5g0432761 [Medicago truncatula]